MYTTSASLALLNSFSRSLAARISRSAFGRWRTILATTAALSQCSRRLPCVTASASIVCSFTISATLSSRSMGS
eukprot:scaffold39_cov173-Pinguiococcus_pyrenoidosus.AAC.1